MKRAFFTAVTLAAIFVPRAVRGTDPFEQKLSSDQEIVHALNRLTFGARPGDADRVRRTGLAKWKGASTVIVIAMPWFGEYFAITSSSGFVWYRQPERLGDLDGGCAGRGSTL